MAEISIVMQAVFHIFSTELPLHVQVLCNASHTMTVKTLKRRASFRGPGSLDLISDFVLLYL